MDVLTERLTVLPSITLQKGGHDNFEEGHCAMEVVAWLAGEGHTDAPSCASRVLRVMTVAVNDSWSDDYRQTLVPLLPLMVGTADDGKDEARSFMALNWAVSIFTPKFLDLAGFVQEASLLRGLKPVRDEATAEDAYKILSDLYRKFYVEKEPAGITAESVAWRSIRQTGVWAIAKAQNWGYTPAKIADVTLAFATDCIGIYAQRIENVILIDSKAQDSYSQITSTVSDVRESLLELLGDIIDPTESTSASSLDLVKESTMSAALILTV